MAGNKLDELMGLYGSGKRETANKPEPAKPSGNNPLDALMGRYSTQPNPTVYIPPIAPSTLEQAAPQTQAASYSGAEMPTLDDLRAGQELYAQRSEEQSAAKRGFWGNLWNSFGAGDLLNQEIALGAGATDRYLDLVEHQQDAISQAGQYRQQIDELYTPIDWEGRQELIDEYRSLQESLRRDRNEREYMGDVLPEDYAAREQRMNDLRTELELRDIAAGNGAGSYSWQDRANNVIGGSGKRIGSTLTNALATTLETGSKNYDLMLEADPYAFEFRGLHGGNEDSAGTFTDEERHESLRALYDTADRLGNDATEDLQRAKNGLPALGQAGVDIAENMLEMGFDAAVGAVTGGGSLASMFVRVYGQSTMEARQAGATLEQQNAYGLTTAGIEVFTEKLADGVAGIYGKGAADEITEKLVGRLAKTNPGRSFLRLVIGAGEEGMEEVISDLLSPFADAIYKTDALGNRMGLGQLYSELFSEDGMEQMLYDFLIGAAVGLIGGTGNYFNGGNARANAELALQDYVRPTVEKALSSQESRQEWEKANKISLPEGGKRAERQARDTVMETETQRVRNNYALDTAISSLGITDESQRKVLRDGLDIGTADAETYIPAMTSAVKIGSMGLTLEQAKKNAGETGLTDAQFEHAWQIGAQNPRINTAKATATVNGQQQRISLRSENGRTMVDVTGEDGTVTSMTLDEAMTSDTVEIPEGVKTTIRQLSAVLGQDAVGAYEVFSGNMTSSSYAAAMRDAIHVFAANGADVHQIAARLRSQGISTGIAAFTDAQLDFAQKAGETLYNAEKTADERRSESISQKPKKIKGKTGKVITRGAVDAQGHQLKGIDNKNLSREQKSVVSAIGRLSRVMPLNYVVYDGDATGTQGYYEAATGTVYVNVNAGGGITVAALGTLTHEIVHSLKVNAPAQYRALMDEITKIYFKNDPALFANRVHKWMEEGGDTQLSEQAATDEVIANSCMRMLDDSNAIEQVAEDNPELARNIFDTLKKTVSDILRKMKAIYAEDRFYLLHKAEFEKARQLFAEAFAAASENMQREGVPTGEKTQYMKWTGEKLQRNFIDYSEDNVTVGETAIEEKVNSLIERGKTVPITVEEVMAQEGKANWSEFGAARKYVRDTLSALFGSDSVFISDNGTTVEAYLTKDGRKHSAGYVNSKVKAATLFKAHEIIKNAEYVFSSKYDEHSTTGQKNKGAIWDYYTAVATYGRFNIPVRFTMIDSARDTREQIYKIGVRTEDASLTNRGQENLGAMSNAGEASSNKTIAPAEEKSNRQNQSWEKMSETERKQTIRENKSFNAAQTETGSPLKTLKGSDISRGGTINKIHYDVGKVIASRLYIHKSAVDTAIRANPEFGRALAKAERALREAYPDFTYNCLNYHPATGEIQFQEAPNFDTAREPVVGKQVNVQADGSVSEIKNFGQIWHHKWQWVDNDYDGFNVRDSWNWSRRWLSTILGASKGGSINAWNGQLAEYGLPVDKNAKYQQFDNEAAPVTQQYSSEDTSINQNKLPGVFTSKWFTRELTDGGVNIDIGGGKYDNAAEHLKQYGVTNMVFDPFNRNRQHNKGVLDYIMSGKRGDTVTVANVLNVIQEAEARENVILESAKAMKPDGKAYFLIYEGDKTGNGRTTRTPVRDQNGVIQHDANGKTLYSTSWQEHRAAQSYVEEISKYFDKVVPHSNLIVAENPKADLPRAAWEITPGEAVRYQKFDSPDAMWTEETLDDHIEYDKYGRNKSDAYVVRMNLDDFLKLTTDTDEVRDRRQRIEQGARQEYKELDTDKLSRNEERHTGIHLTVDTDTGRVEGHEGRHRAVLLLDAGIKTVPVMIINRDHRYEEKSVIPKLTLKGQELNGELNSNRVTVTDMIPMTEAYRDELVKRFASSEGNTARYQKYTDDRVSSSTERQLESVNSTATDGVVVTTDLAEIMRTEGFSKPVDPMDELNAKYQVWTTDDWASNYLRSGGDPEVAAMIRSFTDAMIANDAIMEYVPSGHYQKSKMGPLRKNIEYRWTYDMDASCPRTFQFVHYRNALQKIAGRPLTMNESLNLMYLMRRMNQQIPCTYCYVENKRIMKSKSYLEYFQYRNDVMSAATDEEALTKMYSYNADKGTVGDAARKVFDEWREDVRNGSAFHPSAEECWTGWQTAKNSVFNWLDQQLADGSIRFGDKVKGKTSTKKMVDMICRQFDITDKAARREIEGFVAKWQYDVLAGNGHVYDIPNDTSVSEVNQDMLKVHRLATNYASSVSQARLVDDYVPYTDQLKNVSEEDKKYIMGMGGIRKHSSNDFRMDYVQDYFLFYADLARGGWTGHTYTKSVDFCKVFGRCHDRINLSIAMNTENGKIVENQQEGAAWKDARALRKAYGDLGVMAMVTDNAQLSFALNSDWIDMCIPFHASGLPKAVWYNLRAWFDYTSVQLESYFTTDEMRQKLIDAGVDVKGLNTEQVEALYNSTFNVPIVLNKKGGRVKPHFFPEDTEVIGPNGEVQIIPGHHNDTQRYFELCEQYGVHPRFYGVEVTDASGNVIDVTEHPNYVKLIKETSRTDTAQQPIEFNFNEYDENLGMSPMDYAMKRMQEEARNGGFANTAEDPWGIVPMFKDLYLNQNRDIGWIPERNESKAARQLHRAMRYTAKAYNEMYDADVQTLDTTGYQKALIEPAGTQYQQWDDGSTDTAEERRARNEATVRLAEENRLVHETIYALNRDIKKLRSQTWTGGTVSQTAADQIARSYISEYNSNADIGTISTMLRELGNYVMSTQQIDENRVREMATAIANELVRNAKPVAVESGDTAEYIGIADEIRGRKFYLSESDRESMEDAGGYNAFRKANFGRFLLGEGGEDVNAFYSKLQKKWGKEIFPDVNSRSDKLMIMSDVFDRAKPVAENPYIPYVSEMVNGAANDIINEALQKAQSEVQSQQKKLSKNIERMQERINALRAEKNARIEEIRLQSAARLQEAVAREKAAKWEKVSQVKEYYQRKEAEARERRQNAVSVRKLRQRIQKLYKEFIRQIQHPTETRHIPPQLMKQAADVLAILNMDNSRPGSMAGEKLKEKLAALKATYDAIQKDNDYAGAVYDPIVSEMMQLMIEQVGDTPINRMSREQLEIVFNTLKAMQVTAKNALKIQLGEEERDAYRTSVEMTNETRSARNLLGRGMIARWLNAQLSPERMFNRLGGNHKNSTWSKVYRMLNAGQLKSTRIFVEGSRIFEHLMGGKAYDAFVNPKNTVDIGLKDENGNAVPITHGMMVSLYMHLLNEDNIRHAMLGGIEIPALKDYYNGRKTRGSEQSVRVGGIALESVQQIAELREQLNTVEDPNERQEILDEISELQEEALGYADTLRSEIERAMTEYDRQWIAALKSLFDEFSKNQINETTMAVYGIKKASVENYYPIWVSGDFLNTPFESVARDFSIENAGFLKERVTSSKPIRLADASEVASSQLKKVAQYCGLMPVIRDFNKIWGKTQLNYVDSLRSAVHQVFGQTGTDYVEHLMADLNGSRKTDDGFGGEFLGRMRGHMAQAALTMSMRTAFGQTASYPTAASVVGWGPLMKALAKGGKSGMPISRADKGLIEKWSPLLAYRMKGYSSIELGDIASSNSRQARLWQKMRWLTGWIQFMDGATVGRLWYAAEYYVQDHNADLEKGSDAYYEEVAKVFNDIVEKTQPDYTTMQRPDILRNTNALVRSLTMFMTQRLQNFNILYDAAANLTQAKRDYAAGRFGVTREDVHQAAVDTRRAALSQVVAAATITAFKFLADVVQHSMNAYRDKDKNLTEESVSLQLLNMFLDSMIGNFLWGGELYDLLESRVFGKTYYGIEVSGVGTVTDLIESTNNLITAALENKLTPAKWNSFAKNLATVLGIPLSNAEKIVMGIVYHAQDIANQEFLEFNTGVAWTKGNTSTVWRETLKPLGITEKRYADILAAADAHGDGNGSLKQDELGAELEAAMKRGEVTSEQATAIWNARGWKKTFAEWQEKNGTA